MARYDFAAMGTAAGIGQGLAGAGKSIKDTYMERRRQDQMFFLGIQKLMLQVKSLDEEKRQADHLQRRFYDGLEAQDLRQIRDYKVRRSLEETKHNLLSNRMVTDHQFAMERIREQGDISKAVAATQAAVGHGRNANERRRIKLQQAEAMDKWASRFASSKLIHKDGPRAGQMMSDNELQSHAWGVAGIAGGADGLKQAWYEEFKREMLTQHGKKAPIPTFQAFDALLKLHQTGDIRKQAEWRQGVENQAFTDVYAAPTEAAADIYRTANYGMNNLGIKWDHVAGRFSPVDGEEKGQKVGAWVNSVILSAPNQAGTKENFREWRTAAENSWNKTIGGSLYELTKGESAMIDMFMNQASKDYASGKVALPPGVTVEPGIDLNLLRVDDVAQDRIFSSAQQLFNHGIPATVQQPTSTMRPGYSTGQIRSYSHAIGSAITTTNSSRADFTEQYTNGNIGGSVQVLMAAREQYEELIKPETSGLSGVNKNQYDAAVEDLKNLINDMIIDVSKYKADPELPEGAGIEDLIESIGEPAETPEVIEKLARESIVVPEGDGRDPFGAGAYDSPIDDDEHQD